MKQKLGRIRIAVAIALTGTVFGFSSPAFARDYRPHSGYVDSTLAERGEQSTDLQLITPPSSSGPGLQQLIFNETLSKEFTEKYEDKFGRTDAERIYNSPNRSTYYNDVFYQGSPQEYTEERRKFGDYMLKRLAEYHVDDFMKNNPNGRAIYEIKEKVSNVNVKVQSFQFDLRYEIAGNTADVIVKNPYLKTAKVRLQMNPGAFGPGTVDETIVTVGTDVTRTISFESFYSMPLNNLSFVTRKVLTPALVGSLSLVDSQRNLGADAVRKISSNWIRESVYLAGLSLAF